MSFDRFTLIEGFEAPQVAQIKCGLKALDKYFSDDFVKSIEDEVVIEFVATTDKPRLPVRLEKGIKAHPVIAIHRRNVRLAPAAIYGVSARLLALSVGGDKLIRDFDAPGPLAEFYRAARKCNAIKQILWHSQLRSTPLRWCGVGSKDKPVFVSMVDSSKDSNTRLQTLPWRERREVRRAQLEPSSLFLRCVTRLIQEEGDLAGEYERIRMAGIPPTLDELLQQGEHVPYRFLWPDEEINSLLPIVRRCMAHLHWKSRTG